MTTSPPHANHAFLLSTLGSVSLVAPRDNASTPTILRRGKPLALLIYLACSPGRTASREHLLNLLWADAEPERGLRTLRQTVFQLRQSLGEDAIVSDGRSLTLAIDLNFDRDKFLAAVARQDTAQAVTLYNGLFLPDFGVPGGAEFEQWADRERDRLQSAYIRCAEVLIRSRLDHAQYGPAIVEVRRLRDFDPNRESSWRLLFESLCSSGDRLSALAEAEELERFLTAEDREPESLTRSAIARAKKSLSPAATTDSPTDPLVAELTGRDREFSILTSAWVAVKGGHFRHIHVSAPPGLGKTRLLRDVFTRFRASGARSIWTTALPGDRQLAYALASDIAASVGSASGASGISTAAASSLVALNPSLSSSFAASADRADGEEALRHRVHAVTELFEAVAEEAPLALFVDDMHWSDPVSRQLLRSALSRIGNIRLLLITSSRTVPDGNLHLTGTEPLSLDPLTVDHVRDLVTGFGALSDNGWSNSFVAALHQQTAGSPLLILENLRLAMDRGLLELRDGNWYCSDTAALIEGISSGDVLEQRLKKVEPDLFRIVLLLAIADEPLSVAVMAAALSCDRTTLERNLATLEQHALAVSVADAWRHSHDSVAETAVRMVTIEDRAAIHGALGNALALLGSSDQHHFRLAIRHLTAGGKREEAEEVFAKSVALARASGDRRSHAQLAAAMLGESSVSDSAARLVASLPLMQRVGVTGPGRIAALSALLAVAVMLPLQMRPAKPSQLALSTQPLAANLNVVPSPVVEIHDKHGRRVRGADDSVTVDVVGGKPGLAGTLTVAAVDGRAEFKDVSVTGEGAAELRFRTRGLTEIRAWPINVEGNHSTLQLVSGTINGHQITPTRRTITVAPGSAISGTLVLKYSSFWPSASVILGATATWGDRRKNFLDLAPLFTPAVDQPRRTSIRFTAPETPGIYHIVVAFDAEGNVEDFMSGTNWRIAKPVWGDGNDIVDWTPAQLAEANAKGWVQSRIVQIDDATGREIFKSHPVPATVIDVVVK